MGIRYFWRSEAGRDRDGQEPPADLWRDTGGSSPQAEDSQERFVDPPELLVGEVTDQLAQPSGVDGADLLGGGVRPRPAAPSEWPRTG